MAISTESLEGGGLSIPGDSHKPGKVLAQCVWLPSENSVIRWGMSMGREEKKDFASAAQLQNVN